MKLLLATKNPGKVEEITDALKTQPFDIISVDELDASIPEPEEPYGDVVLNAIEKAKYYGKKTNLLALADDGGFSIDSLDGWPGAGASRVAETDEKRQKTVLEKLKGIDPSKRSANFFGALALYNPKTDEVFVATGRQEGSILEEPAGEVCEGLPYDQIFFDSSLKKANAELTLAQKGSVGWRGEALQSIKYYLDKQYGAKHIVVPVGIIVNEEKKILLGKRHDPHRPEYHGKWEFPGGTVELGEDIRSNLIREVKEEVGYDVRIINQVSDIFVRAISPYEGFTYQVYLVPYLCTITGGDGNPDDQEISEVGWFTLEEARKLDHLADNDVFFDYIFEELSDHIEALYA